MCDSSCEHKSVTMRAIKQSTTISAASGTGGFRMDFPNVARILKTYIVFVIKQACVKTFACAYTSAIGNSPEP